LIKKLPDSGFDRIASFYDALAYFVYGDSLQRAQKALLPFIPDQGRILIIGGGSGWILVQLIKTGKHLDILYLDAAPAMLNKAKKKYQKIKSDSSIRIEFRLGTEQEIKPQEQYDVIFTPFILDLFLPQRLQQLMTRLKVALSPTGSWLFVDFWPVTQSPPYWQKMLIKGMYLFFGTLSGVKARKLPDYNWHFNNLGLKEKFSKSFYAGMVQAKAFVPHNPNNYI
jgi:tRNA (cmo5U34)-methyltransferase